MSKIAAIVRLVVIGLACLFLCACSNPKNANKSNFLAAVNVHLEKNSGDNDLCFGLYGYDEFDEATRTIRYVVYLREFEDGSAQQYSKVNAMLMLSELGYFKNSTELTGSYRFQQMVIRYEPIGKIKNQVEFGRAKGAWGGTVPQLCAGAQLEAVEVTSFTEPADLQGVRVSRATVKLRYVNVPSWANLEEVKVAWAEEAQLADGNPFLRDVTFVLKDSGWIVDAFGKK